MKHLTGILMSIFIAGMLLNYSAVAEEGNKEKKEINIQIIAKYPNRNRSVLQSIEASYSSEKSTIDIICYGAKETLIYIVDAAGDVAGYETFDFSVSPYFTMDAPVEKGTYWLVLDSAELYAEGNFVVQ